MIRAPLAGAVALCVVGCGDPTPTRTHSVAGSPIPCRSSELRIAAGPQVSPATGQNPVSFAITNRGAKPCVLKGYPEVAFLSGSGKRLPFRVSHGGDQMITSRPPAVVHVPPRRSGFFVLNKYRCDRGNLAVATKLRFGLPRDATSAHLIVTIPTYPILAYCGRDDPGSVVTVSPFVSTVAAALAREK